MISHAAYIEKLDSLSAASPEWRAVAAGLLVLRLVDTWLQDGANVIRRDRLGLEAVRQTLGKLSDADPTLPLLAQIVDIVEQSEAARVQWVSPCLLQYGTLLERQAQWTCAHDVFCSVREHAKVASDPWLTMWSAIRAGPLARHLADLDTSDHTYRIADQEARLIGHQDGQLRARLGIARNALSRHGDVSQAISVVHSLATEAQLYAQYPFLSIALHELACLYFARGQHYTAIKFAVTARHLSDDTDQIDRIKAQVAASLVCLGHLTTARKIHLALVRTAREEYLRQTALINLVELTALDGNRTLFEQYCQQLHAARLTAHTRSIFHLFAGQGLYAFGQVAAAQKQLHSAFAIAIEHRFTNLLPVIGANLSAVGRPTSTVVCND